MKRWLHIVCWLLLASSASGLELYVNETTRTRVSFLNLDPEPFRIRRIDVSCTCIQVERHPAVVLPDQEARIELALRPKKTGSYRFEISAISRDEVAPKTVWLDVEV
ncbi:MAG: DUF1573 domain-containing protein, partial [Verrucomicrobiota bacterium]